MTAPIGNNHFSESKRGNSEIKIISGRVIYYTWYKGYNILYFFFFLLLFGKKKALLQRKEAY